MVTGRAMWRAARAGNACAVGHLRQIRHVPARAAGSQTGDELRLRGAGVVRAASAGGPASAQGPGRAPAASGGGAGAPELGGVPGAAPGPAGLGPSAAGSQYGGVVRGDHVFTVRVRLPARSELCGQSRALLQRLAQLHAQPP